MGLPAAKSGDQMVGAVTSPQQAPFEGALADDLVPTVRVNGQLAAVAGSGGLYDSEKGGVARIIAGSVTVRIAGRPAARLGDPVVTQDGSGAPNGSGTVVTGPSTVFIG
ncbi:MAG TPA: PAAR domain-containing protein [Chloroflexota bacterium]|nr:PAAR domain-containing protein [Chloroflexota bacterium]